MRFLFLLAIGPALAHAEPIDGTWVLPDGTLVQTVTFHRGSETVAVKDVFRRAEEPDG